MKEETMNVTVRVIVPDSGNVLTQASDVDIKERVFSEKIWLACNDSPDNWKEISEAEANELRKQKEEAEKASENIEPLTSEDNEEPV